MSEKYGLNISMCSEKLHLISFNDLTLQRVRRKYASFHETNDSRGRGWCSPRSNIMPPLPTLLRWSCPLTLEQPADLFDKLYTRPAPLATLYNSLPGTLQYAGRNCTSFHLLTYGHFHKLFNNLRIFSMHRIRDLCLSQHCIIICQVHGNVPVKTAAHFIYWLKVIPTHFSTTCGSFKCTIQATYAFRSVLRLFANDKFSGKIKFARTASILIYLYTCDVEWENHL